jgi:uncharacterized protein (DUF3820 family)
MMPGSLGDTVVWFGKYKGCSMAEIPNSYLRWCLGEEWLEEKYPTLLGAFEDEMIWRESSGIIIED